MLLLSNPDILLLDEPTNHLDMESIAWLETYSAELSGSCFYCLPTTVIFWIRLSLKFIRD